MNNAVYGKAMENLRNRDGLRLVKNKNDYLKRTATSSFVTPRTFGNQLVTIHKIQITSRLNKHEYVGVYILQLNKMNSIIIISKTNTATNRACYSQIPTTSCMKLIYPNRF